MLSDRRKAHLVLQAAIAIAAVVLWSTPVVAQDGPIVFKAKCAMCHGADGKGATPMGKQLKIRDLGSPEVQKQTDAELTTIIAKGKGKMTPFGAKLTPEQITQVVAHLRTLGKK